MRALAQRLVVAGEKRWHQEGNGPVTGGRNDKETDLARIVLNHMSSEYRHDVKRMLELRGSPVPSVMEIE